MQIVMFAVNSADFVYFSFVLCFVWLFEIQFVCRFALFVGVWLASVAAASFWCYVVLFCISTFIFIYLCCVRVALYRRSGAASYLFCFVSFAAAACFFFFSFFLRCPLTNRIALRIAVVVVVFVASIPALCHRSIEEVATVTTSILATRVNDKMLSIKSECKTATANCSSSLPTVSLSIWSLLL